MREVIEKISADDYKKLSDMKYKDREKYLFPEGIPDAWRWGYGYYGHTLSFRDGNPCVVHRLGSSCD